MVYENNLYIQVNVLLQAYISQLKLEGFALTSDMVYVTQVCSGSREDSFTTLGKDLNDCLFYSPQADSSPPSLRSS